MDFSARWERIRVDAEIEHHGTFVLCEEHNKLRAAAVKLHEDAMTMALRLMGEDEESFAPETLEVMERWKDKCMVRMARG